MQCINKLYLLAFVRGINRWPVDSAHKGPVTRNVFPFNDVIMICIPSVRVLLIQLLKLFDQAETLGNFTLKWHMSVDASQFTSLQAFSLRWRHNGRDSVSNHQPHDCLLSRLFRRRSQKTSNLRVTGLCVGNAPGTGEFPAQMASSAEYVSIWLRHNDMQPKHQSFTDSVVKTIRPGRNVWLFHLNPLRPRQNGRHFADDIFKCIFLNGNVWISIKISLKFVPKGPINNIPALVQIMAWRRPGDKPLSQPMMVNFPTHICVSRPQWVKMTHGSVASNGNTYPPYPPVMATAIPLFQPKPKPKRPDEWTDRK